MPVDFYVDTDDMTVMMAFRWFYERGDVDARALASVAGRGFAQDELAVGRSVHSTPVEFVRGSAEVAQERADDRKFCLRDYDERKKRLYKTRL